MGELSASIISSVIGIFAFNDKQKIIERVLFPRDAERVAEKLEAISKGEPIDELLTLIKRLTKSGFTQFIFEDKKIAEAIRSKLNVEAKAEMPSIAGRRLRRDIGKIAVETGFVEDQAEFNKFLLRVSTSLTRMRIKAETEKASPAISQAIMTLDSINQILNSLLIRTREWYGCYFPEMGKIIKGHEAYLRLIEKIGVRESFTRDKLETMGLPKEKVEALIKAARSSVGVNFSAEDLEQLRNLCREALRLFKLRESLTKYVSELVQRVAPNLAELAGPLIGARLISKAGGLEKLARMPSSKIQILGAEKALFKSLKSKGKPPKHGIIFQHPDVHSAKRELRGKIARLLASKIALAARLDMFTGRYDTSLKKDYNERLAKIKERWMPGSG